MNGVDKRKLMRKTVLCFFSNREVEKKESDYSNQTQLCSGEMSLAVIPEDEAAQTDIDVTVLFFLSFDKDFTEPSSRVRWFPPRGAGGGGGGEGLWGWWVPSS